MDATFSAGDEPSGSAAGGAVHPVAEPFPDGVRLNEFFGQRKILPERVDRCPVCAEAAPFKPFMVVKGVAGTEGEGVWMPAERCPHCGMVFLNPRVPSDGAALFYQLSERLLGYFTSGTKAVRDEGAGFAPFARLIERNVKRDQAEVFDIGCGAGGFLRFMSGRGFRVAGAEINPSVAEAARTRYSLDVITADAEQAVARMEEQKRTFDVVTMIHTFEHLTRPVPILERLRAIVRPGGIVAINVPNIRYFLVPLDRSFGTSAAGIWDSVSHFSYFSLRSLSLACQRAGYTVVDRDSRLLVSGRTGAVGLVDDVVSWICRSFGGLGSNIAVVARLP